MKNLCFCACCLVMCATVFGQDLQSGLWYADGRSAGMGGALMAVDKECFRVITSTDGADFVKPDNGDIGTEENGIISDDDTGLWQEQDPANINKEYMIRCRAYANGIVPYCMSDIAVFSAGAEVGWKQYSWSLHGGWSGKDEQFVSLLFGHTVGQKWRYVVGVAVYRLDIGSVTGGASSKTTGGASSKTAEGALNTGVSRALMAFMAEAGVFYRPLENLQFGVWMGNPTLTHKDSLYFATDFHLGTVWNVSERLQFVFELEKQLQHSLFAHAGMETAIWRPSNGIWRIDGRLGVRYPYTEVSAGLGIARCAKMKMHLDAAAVCNWKLGWTFAASLGVGF